MKRILLIAVLLALPPAIVLPAVAQQDVEVPLSMRSLDFDVSSLGGYAVHGVARGVEGLDYSAGASVTTPGNDILLHRVILDSSHHLYFGYDVEIFPSSLPGKVHVHFMPLSDLRGFHFDASAFQPATIELPADKSVELGAPTEVPLETADGQTILRDTLTFTPAP
jgi:hypothetical protein